MHIGEILNLVYDEDVGWRPASGGIKPVHVANGLVRALSGRYHDTSALNKFIVWAKRGSALDDRTFAALVEGDPDGAYAAFRDRPHDFDRARRYARGLLNADGAAFPAADQSSLSLTCLAMASRDPNDRGLGDFAALLLRDGGSSLTDRLLSSLDAERPMDPITTVVWPLLESEGKPYKGNDRVGKALKRRHNQACMDALRAAAADLATHEAAQGNPLRTLQRAVHFACVATHAHAQALAAGGALADRPPALVALGGHRRSDISIASERSLDLIYERFELWLADRVAARLADKKPLKEDGDLLEVSKDGRTARRVLASIGVGKTPHNEPDKEIVDARMANFQEAQRAFGKDDPARCLGHALVAAYRREYVSGGPRAFLQTLGRRAGFLYPPFQGRAREKRVRPSVPVLDLLVRACVPAGEAVPLDDFLGRLWERFGLIVGGRKADDWEDGDVLAQHGVPVDASALIGNTDELVAQLVTMGLARRYPDDVTFVGDGYVG